jgi:DNA-binding response OmpR family regulator
MTRLLVADDSETVLLMLERRLELAGYEVITATDGNEVLEHLRSAPPEQAPDLILLDAMMPRLSGVDALREIRASGNDTPILIISAHLYAESPEEMIRLGADGCVPKPFEWEDLVAQIEEHVGPGTARSV